MPFRPPCAGTPGRGAAASLALLVLVLAPSGVRGDDVPCIVPRGEQPRNDGAHRFTQPRVPRARFARPEPGLRAVERHGPSTPPAFEPTPLFQNVAFPVAEPESRDESDNEEPIPQRVPSLAPSVDPPPVEPPAKNEAREADPTQEPNTRFDPADATPSPFCESIVSHPSHSCADGCDSCDDCCCSPLHCTPQMIGDFFGFVGSSIRFDNQSTSRLGVFTRNLPRNDFFPPTDPLAVAAANVTGSITLDPNINGGSFGTAVQVFPIANGGFTSTLSSNAVRDLLQANNGATVPIVDAAAYNGVAATAAGQRFGAGGVLVFVPTESGALALNPTFGDNILSAGFDVLYVYDYLLQMQVASPSTSGVAVGRQKIAENGSPLCRDRVFVDYGFLGDGQFFPGGVDVHRVVPGFEKCFGNRFSVEMRFPFASTLDSDILAGGTTSTDSLEFGNVTTYFKVLLAGGQAGDNFAVSAGLGIALPTGDDVRVYDLIGTELVTVDNESVHLLPFVGGVYTPNNRLFMQGFAQLDLDTNGNPVSVHDYASGQLVHAGRAQDVNYAYLDAGVGYWLLPKRCRPGWVQGVAPMLEMHYNLPLGDTDVVTSANGFQVGNWMDRAEALNGVVGVNFALRHNASLTAAYVTPLGGFDEQYDGAFRLTFNWLLGP